MEIYCNNDNCLFYELSDEDHRIGEDRLLSEPFEHDVYRGKCGCKKVFVRRKRISTHIIDHDLSECASFSNKRYAGHMDFSRFPGRNDGHIPD